MSSTPGKVKPGGIAFLIPLGIWIVISIVAVGIMISAGAVVSSTVDDLARIEPGEAVVTLESEGGYRIFAEGDGVDDAFLDPVVNVTITGPSGEVATQPYVGSLEYSNGGNEGTAVLTFDAPAAGDYTFVFTPGTASGSAPTAENLAVGKANPISEGGKRVLLGVVVGTLGFLLAVIVAIVLLVKRSGSKKRLRAAGAFGGPPPGGYGGPPPPGGGFGGPPPPPGGGGYGAPPSGGGFGGPPPPPGGGGYGAPPPSGQSWGAPPPPPGS